MRKPSRREEVQRSTPPLDEAISPEIYRQIYVSLELPADSYPVIGVTSAIAGEGRTTVAVGLARTLAEDLEAPVLLAELDLENPSLEERFGLPPSAGLCDVLQGVGEVQGPRISDVVQPVTNNLFVATAGSASQDNARLLRQLHLYDPFHTNAWRPAVTVLDLPPIMNHSYSALAATVSDALVLVVRAGVTPIDLVSEAIARLEDSPPRGVVLMGAASALPAWWPGGGV